MTAGATPRGNTLCPHKLRQPAAKAPCDSPRRAHRLVAIPVTPSYMVRGNRRTAWKGRQAQYCALLLLLHVRAFLTACIQTAASLQQGNPLACSALAVLIIAYRQAGKGEGRLQPKADRSYA